MQSTRLIWLGSSVGRASGSENLSADRRFESCPGYYDRARWRANGKGSVLRPDIELTPKRVQIPTRSFLKLAPSSTAERNFLMLRAIKTNGGKVGEVSGNPAEVIMFFGFWQFNLWPNWMEQAKLGSENDAMHRQVSGMLDAVKDGKPLLLNDASKEFEQAFDFAVEKCKSLGINVIDI